METKRTDVAVIGAGTAGLNAHREAVRAGRSVLLIEEGPYGTTCARVGCMPSKLLITPANLLHELTRYERFGLSFCGNVHVDGPAVLRHVRRQRDAFVEGMVRLTEAIPSDQRLRGHARFVGPTTLEVEGFRVEAKAIVIAAGSGPFIPPSFDRIADRVLTSDNIFELQDLPGTMAVIGTGIIGMELGQAFHRLGVKTTLFGYSDAIGPLTDPAIQEKMKDVFGGQLQMRLSVRITDAFAAGDGMHLRWHRPDGSEFEDVFETVLMAAGRRPNIKHLGLENIGVPLDERGLPHFNRHTMQCGDRPIFMAGDVDDDLPVLHEAAAEGIIAGTNAAAFPKIRPHPRHTPLMIAFTEPQMARAGKSFARLEEGSFAAGQADFDDQARAVILGQNEGRLRIYAETDTCRIIGAEMFVPGAEHLAHQVAAWIQQNMTVEQALALPFYHPVLEEGLRAALRDLAAALQITGKCRRQDMAIMPGT
ncbi:MAG: dihydrolipoyl dehydrogenase [Planctomycetaceae bacterium]|nr:dihydrolipoyl dehydrogenase [Planctomycetaceae bacterium]